MNDFDDDDPDFNGVTEIEVGVEFEGLHMISLHATVSVDLEDPMAATKRLQNVISILKKSIPASEYTEDDWRWVRMAPLNRLTNKPPKWLKRYGICRKN